MATENCSSCISASTVALSYIEESCICPGGEIQAPIKMRTLDASNRNINPTRNTIESNDFRSDRNKGCTRSVEDGSSGSIDFDWKACENNADLIDAALSNYRADAAAVNAIALSAIAPNQYQALIADADFAALGVCEGQLVTFSGFANPENNGTKLVCAVETDITLGTSTITVYGSDEDATYPVLINESVAAANVAAVGNVVQVGQSLRTFTVERGLAEGAYQLFRGVGVNGLSLSASPDSFITGSFDLLGFGEVDYCNSTSLSTPLDAASCCGSIYDDVEFFLGCEKLCGVTSFDFSLNNNMSQTKASCEGCLSLGQVDISGSLSIFFTDCAQQEAVKNNIGQALSIVMWNEDRSDFINFTFPYVTFNSANMDPVQGEPLTQTIEWTASVGGVCNTSMLLQRSFAIDPLVRNRIELSADSDTLDLTIVSACATILSVDWGDGVVEDITASNIHNLSHSYNPPYGAGVVKNVVITSEDDCPITDFSVDAGNVINANLCYLTQLETASITNSGLACFRSNSSALRVLDLGNNAVLSEVELATSNSLLQVNVSGGALNQVSVDTLLQTASSSTALSGTFDSSGGTNAAPSSEALQSINALVTQGWTVITN